MLDDSSVVTVSSNRHGGYASSAVTLADDGELIKSENDGHRIIDGP